MEETKVDPEEKASSPSPLATGNREKKNQYCSMCWVEDTEHKLLFECSVCHVVYHNECYRGVSIDCVQLEGLEFEESENGAFADVCVACASVGKRVTGRTQGGVHHNLTIDTRPYECCFCTVDDPSLPLPMHPIYDRNNGRQLILERWAGAPEEVPTFRLAWCHTLCAQFIGIHAGTAGCVYSCNLDGTYGGYYEDDDDRSISSEVAQARKSSRTSKPSPDANPILTLSLYGYHHFCIVLPETNHTAYTKAIKNAQKFQCQVCSAVDRKANVWRMAIPCMCREKQEPKNFARCHKAKDHECIKAMHVGCAMWGRRINGQQRFPPSRRVYYEYMDGEGDYRCLIYCNKHAKNIRDNGTKNDIEGCEWRHFPGLSRAMLLSPKGGKDLEDAKVRIENENDTIESDYEDFVGDLESDDDEVTHSHSESMKYKMAGENRHSNATTKRKRDIVPPKLETARDRLERKLAQKGKSPTAAATGISATARGVIEGLKQSAPLTVAPTRRLPVAPATQAVESAVDAPAQELKIAPQKPRKSALKLMGLLNGKGVNWNA